MKNIMISLTSAALSLIISACAVTRSVPPEITEAISTAAKAESAVQSDVSKSETTKTEAEEQKERDTMKITAGDKVFTAKLAENSSAEALKELLKKGDLTIEMHDYGNFEKVGDIGAALPQNNEQITTEPGDIILYLGTSITIYYDTNSWNFTRLGKIQNATQKELKEALGSGNVTVTFSLG